MRCNALNFCYEDSFGVNSASPRFEFSPAEIFQSKESLLYMRTKIEVDSELLVTLEQEGRELVEMKLRNAERSRGTALAGGGGHPP
jgi:hypothetical protein